MKLVGGNFKANRRRYLFIKCVWVQCFFLPQDIEDAIRQTDKGTQKHQWSANHRSLEAKGPFWKSIYILGHLLLVTISSVSLFCGETGFYSGKYLYSIICLWTYISELLHTAAMCPLCSHTIQSRARRSHPGSCSHYSMENIQTIAVVQMSNFSKQEESEENGLLGQNKSYILSSWALCLWKRGPSLPAVLGPDTYSAENKPQYISTSLLISCFISVLVSSRIELIFRPVAAVFWTSYEKNVDNTDGFSCC